MDIAIIVYIGYSQYSVFNSVQQTQHDSSIVRFHMRAKCIARHVETPVCVMSAHHDVCQVLLNRIMYTGKYTVET